MTETSKAALQGIRVLDLTSGPAGGLTTMMLADFGAEVLLVTRPGRQQPFAQLAAAPMWQRGKQSLELDLGSPAALEQLHALCGSADVLVCNWRPRSLEAKGLDAESVRRRHPHLVFCHITGYGHEGPLANLPGYEHAAAALCGRMQLFQGLVDRTGPVFSALQVGIHACAQSAATGILAALHARTLNGGNGARVNTSLLQGLMAYEQGAMLGQQYRTTHPDALPTPPPLEHTPPMPSLYYHPAQAADGTWMQFGNLLPHLFDNFLVATDLIDIVADPDFNPTQLLLPPEKHEAFRERMLLRIQSRSAADWMADLVANGSVVATAYQTTQEALRDPDIVANGHALAREDGSVQLGPVARLMQTPAKPGPELQAQNGRVDEWLSSPRATPVATTAGQLPLRGIKVLEIATIIAAPFGASLLADLGAEVIKIEQVGGDPYRGMLLGVGSSRVNAGKRSISINLKSEQGKQIVLDLARSADILIHNYRPGVPERLGIGYEQLRAINPELIYVQSNGYGPDGPGALRPSTHPIPGAAMGGVLYQMGERVPDTPQDMDSLRQWTRRLMRANEVNPDPNTALVVATSAMLGLAARNTTGHGQQILLDMFGANAYANHDDFLSYEHKPDRLIADEELRGLAPCYRLYQCADEHWVFLAMSQPAEHQRFVQALTQSGVEPTLAPNIEELQTQPAGLEQKLSTLFSQRPASFWEGLCLPADVACVVADAWETNDYWLEHPQATAMGLTAKAIHPAWGAYRRHGAMVTFDDIPPAMAPAPLAGQHNAELLLEYGYTDADINSLQEAGVIWSEVQAER